jgi:hypothetical protein
MWVGAQRALAATHIQAKEGTGMNWILGIKMDEKLKKQDLECRSSAARWQASTVPSVGGHHQHVWGSDRSNRSAPCSLARVPHQSH